MRRLLKHQLRFAQLLDASKGLCKITYFTQVSVSGHQKTGGLAFLQKKIRRTEVRRIFAYSG